ncbi:hypothetical protein [Agromyces sp. NPDC058064]|uniref:hypothetical protein n=1 Tax=Agromyces sp. NPDC058064 TaxID=3346322 RepID=UPI0036DB1E4D
MKLQWVPEQNAPGGSLGAEGFAKLLGRPELDPLTVLVRETAQNSWDARDQSGRPVDFSISLRHLSEGVAETLATDVFAGVKDAPHLTVNSELAAGHVLGLVVSDRKTRGLGGPVLASEVDPGDVYDWADFVLNVGKANKQGHSGGTYGFGKTIAYVVSRPRAVVIHTRTLCEGRFQTRLIASAVGSEFTVGTQKYTGRHWWGVPNSGTAVPILDAEADALAARIGMPSFDGAQLGTNLLILQPELAGRTPEQAANYIADAIVWNLWPKMISHDRSQKMNFRLDLDGVQVPVPSPDERPPLHGFAQAFRELTEPVDDGETPLGYQHTRIDRLRPKITVGHLATLPIVVRDRVRTDQGSDPEDPSAPNSAWFAPAEGCHHVALLRSPRLIVDYLEGPASPEAGVEWAGVFIAEDDLDEVFAKAEPPTHDRWSPSLIQEKPDRTKVQKALVDIRNALEVRWGRRADAPVQAVGTTAVVADRLGFLVARSKGAGPGRRNEARSNRSGRHDTLPVVRYSASGPRMYRDALATSATFEVIPAAGDTWTRVHFDVSVALEGRVGDASLDPTLRLLVAIVGENIHELDGLASCVDVESVRPFQIEVVAARSGVSTVLFDVQAAKVPAGADA